MIFILLISSVCFYSRNDFETFLCYTTSIFRKKGDLYLPIPLSIAIALLRYRLWDIDVLINRALVYGLLMLVLALVYAGLVFGGEALLVGVIGQSNGIIIVGSTLIVAVLFLPLRHRIQQVIDRRFYRRKYDAAKTLAAFSATLRNEVDLDQLSEELVKVVQETMQPTHVSLWLRQPEATSPVVQQERGH